MNNIEKVVVELSEKNLDAFLITNPAELFYLTGIEKLHGYWLLITKSNKTVIFSPPVLYRHICDLSVDKKIEIVKINNFLESLNEFISENKIKILSVDPKKISHDLFVNLNKKVIKIKEKPHFIDRFRMVKTETEIELIRKVCKYNVEILNKIKKFIKPGITEKEFTKKILNCIYEYGLEPCFEPIVAAGKNSSYPHHISGNSIIDNDGIVVIDFGCKYKGYCSDLTRTFFLGKINTYLKKIYETVKKAQIEAIKSIKPKEKISSIDKMARNIIEKKDLGKYFIHSTGHSIGIEVHEYPAINRNINILLEKGMVITVEPGIYVSDLGGVRIEDDILVTKNGYEILT